jgi:hypothetical protein
MNDKQTHSGPKSHPENSTLVLVLEKKKLKVPSAITSCIFPSWCWENKWYEREREREEKTKFNVSKYDN